jgi:dTDP-4-amino-4,6-dideoxygalactose transaminase
MVNVSEAFLPPFKDLEPYLKTIWNSKVVTNNGPLVTEFENKLKERLGVKHLFFVANGTLALQLVLRALGRTGSVITSPYSAVPVLQSILWQNYTPVFTDIDSTDFCMNHSLLPEEIPGDTRAILPTHVYGCACNIEAIDRYASRKGLLTIYDASMAFGSKYADKEIMQAGDVTVFSTHAFKVLNTIEGGVIITRHDDIAEKIYEMRFFGKDRANKVVKEGLNAKNTELHAAIGICNLNYVSEILESRKSISLLYDNLLKDLPLGKLQVPSYCEFNYSYYPILLQSETKCLQLFEALKQEQIMTRRLFHPALNMIFKQYKKQVMPVAEDVALRVLCLPLHHEITEDTQTKIADIIRRNL